MERNPQTERFLDAVEAAGIEYYGGALPKDFVWDLMPIIYIRAWSNTSWTRVKTAFSRAKSGHRNTTIIPVVDDALRLLSAQFDAVAFLSHMTYSAAGLDEKYVMRLIEEVGNIPANADTLFSAYKRFVQPLNDAFSTPRLSTSSYDTLCETVRRSISPIAFENPFCPNFCWPEFILSAQSHLHCKRMTGFDCEPQSAYFAGCYAHMKGWNCRIADTAMVSADDTSSEQAHSPSSSNKARCALGVLPRRAGYTWIQAMRMFLKKDSPIFLLADFNPAKSEDALWRKAAATGEIESIEHLDDCWMLSFAR